MARILLCSSTVRDHDSQEDGCDKGTHKSYRVLELREMLLTFETDFNLVNAAVVCAILKSISGLEPSSDTTEPRYLKLVTVSSFCPFTLVSLLMSLVLSSAWSFRHRSPCHRLWRLCRVAELILPLLLPLLQSHRCQQQSGDW